MYFIKIAIVVIILTSITVRCYLRSDKHDCVRFDLGNKTWMAFLMCNAALGRERTHVLCVSAPETYEDALYIHTSTAGVVWGHNSSLATPITSLIEKTIKGKKTMQRHESRSNCITGRNVILSSDNTPSNLQLLPYNYPVSQLLYLKMARIYVLLQLYIHLRRPS